MYDYDYAHDVSLCCVTYAQGCWDWWGHYGAGAHFDEHGGLQLQAVIGMLKVGRRGPLAHVPSEMHSVWNHRMVYLWNWFNYFAQDIDGIVKGTSSATVA